MTADIISLSDQRRAAEPPPPPAGSGNAAAAAAALAAACHALAVNLQQMRRESVTARDGMERLHDRAQAVVTGSSTVIEAVQGLAGMGRKLSEVAHG